MQQKKNSSSSRLKRMPETEFQGGEKGMSGKSLKSSMLMSSAPHARTPRTIKSAQSKRNLVSTILRLDYQLKLDSEKWSNREERKVCQESH